MTSPFSKPDVWDKVAVSYTETVRHFVQQCLNAVLNRVTLRKDFKVADVACGPGTVSLAIRDKVAHIDALDFSPAMLQSFRDQLKYSEAEESAAGASLKLHHGDGQNLPFASEAYDFYFSMFGLMFFPDRLAGLKEARRVLKPNGLCVLGSWAPFDSSPLMQTIGNAIRAAVPDLPNSPPDEDGFENFSNIESAALSAGFKVESIETCQCVLEIPDADWLWRWFSEGGAPIVVLRDSMSSEEWRSVEARAKEYLAKYLSAPTKLSSEALITILKKTD